MPIYEFACPKCRVIFNFFSQRVSPKRSPVCPKCGNKKMEKQMSSFAMTKGTGDSGAAEGDTENEDPMPNLDDPRVLRAMNEIERDMGNIDENNPKHMAHMMRKMKEMLPSGSVPKEMEVAIKRLEAGEDPEKIEADMGEIFDKMMGGEDGGTGAGGYKHDAGLYDY